MGQDFNVTMKSWDRLNRCSGPVMVSSNCQLVRTEAHVGRKRSSVEGLLPQTGLCVCLPGDCPDCLKWYRKMYCTRSWRKENILVFWLLALQLPWKVYPPLLFLFLSFTDARGASLGFWCGLRISSSLGFLQTWVPDRDYWGPQPHGTTTTGFSASPGQGSSSWSTLTMSGCVRQSKKPLFPGSLQRAPPSSWCGGW